MRTNILFTTILLVTLLSCRKENIDSHLSSNAAPEQTDTKTFSMRGGWTHIDNLTTDNWLRYTEPYGNAISDIANVVTDYTAPSGDNTVFHMGITGSDPYTNVYRYQRKSFSCETNWTYTIRYKYRNTSTPPQAIEFPFCIYTGTQRLEMAVQWVSPIESGNPRWRIWGGTQGYWNDQRTNGTSYGFVQDLAADVWHTLTMTGKIQNNTVYYDKIVSDGVTFTIKENYPGVADATSAQTVLAFQLNNNYRGNEQHVYIDDYSVIWHKRK